MKHLLSIIVILLSTQFAFSQQLQIFGSILDTDSIPLPGATITYDVKNGTVSDVNGNFYIETDLRASIKLTIRFIGYKTIDTLINTEGEGPVFLAFQMRPELIELPNVQITTTYQNIFEEYEPHIIDFIIARDTIFLIVKSGRSTYLNTANLNGTILDEYELIGGYNRFYKSCLGGIILVGQEQCAEMHVIKNNIFVTNEFSVDYFNKYIVPCQLKKDESLIFKNISKHNKKIDYFKYEESQDPVILYSVYDREGEKVSESYYRQLIGQYMSEAENPNLEDIDYGFERDNLIEDGVWNGDIQDLIISNGTQQLAVQYQALGLKAVESDLFVVDQELYIMDRLGKEIIQLNSELNYITKACDFDYRGKITLISDMKDSTYVKINDMLYSVTKNGHSLDIQPFKKLPTIYFNEKNQIYDGTLYRLGRKSINQVRKYIFRESLG